MAAASSSALFENQMPVPSFSTSAAKAFATSALSNGCSPSP
jgi:hypothetical protein